MILVRWLAYVLAALCLLPLIATVFSALSGDFANWHHLASSLLPEYLINTAILAVVVAVLSAIIGTASAWLVCHFRFPGSTWFEYLLALPLAFPAYVMAYAYTDLLDHPGLVQSALRDLMGWHGRDYWFPEVRSLGGAATMLSFVLYPYVYLLARAAFLSQSATAYEVSRTLGRGPWESFWRVSLPMARPAIFGGVMLALMETLADYGTVAYFGVQTFATGIYHAWFSQNDRSAAAQLALCLLILALLLLWLDKHQSGERKVHPAGNRVHQHAPQRLTGHKAWLAATFCALPILIGFIIPLLNLARLIVTSAESIQVERYIELTIHSAELALLAALIIVTSALLLLECRRLFGAKMPSFLLSLCRLGYAIPGGVIAIGLLLPFGALDLALNDWLNPHLGQKLGLVFSGTMLILLLAYLARFMTIGLNTLEAGLAQVKPSLDDAAKTLGTKSRHLFAHIHLPLLKTSLLTAVMIIFVDVMKELPATLILRPFNFDTLAIQAHRLASDERLAEAAVPSLIIVFFGLIPVALLTREIGRRREG